jgi:hypothetical protein
VMHTACTDFQDGNDAVNGAAVVPKPARSKDLVDALLCALAIGRSEPVA